MNSFLRYITTSITFLIFFSCHEEERLFEMQYPAYFPSPHYDFAKNKLTKEGFELGRALFFDPILSIDSTISCESCHAQGHAFADHNVALSKGVFGRKSTRNSPPIINAAWQTSFMWDGGINHIEVMPFAPIDNINEMNETLPNILKKLNRHPKYPDRFKKVFGEGPIHSQQVFLALAQYMSLLISDDSKYDKVRRGLASYTEEEEKGYILFKKHCNSCHSEPLFTDNSFRNNGLPDKYGDKGRATITLDKVDIYKFKVPTLRNISLTHPYMHHGSLLSLRDVLNHYTDGIIAYDNLDPAFKKEDKIGISISDDEKEDIISFLHTLTDYSFISKHHFSE